ncbi:MAG: SusC/RagA family TonB-linked outer membrane protein [Gemmatirosa sp.]|nr:SusC/RagA family TonB-linked outer membrane protein [Gemmatirosa sp.]
MPQHSGRLILIGAVTAAIPVVVQAQQTTTVSGQVTGREGQPIGAVQVYIPSLNVGGQTREDGRYTFTVNRAAGQTVTITARRIGYTQSTAQVTLGNGAVTQNFTLSTAAAQLTGVVVSALSVQREKSTIGTSQQQVSNEELTKTRDPNIVNALSGKVAGVQINSGGAIGGSARIVIRGNNSINGNNQPLFIVDGIPVSNTNVTTAGQAASNGGWDYGNAIRDLNADDIATITVLKGPNAAALYGSRAANGAIVITTKGGRQLGSGISIDANSYTTLERPSRLPDYQNSYGQGAGGEFSYVDGAGGGIQDFNDQSFGPRLDGRLIDQFTGKQQPWVAHPDNVQSFFNTGKSFVNSIGINANAGPAIARISVGNEQAAGIVPGSRINKVTTGINGEIRVNDRLTTTGNVQYVRNEGFNRPGTGYNVGILEQFVWFGRQVDMDALQARRYNDDGSLFNWNASYHNNPYWLVYDNPNRDQRDRVIGSAQGRYRVSSWLTGTIRSGIDTYREARERDYGPGNLAVGVDPNYAGGFYFYNRRESEYNTDGFLTATGSKGHFDLNALVGGNIRRNQVNWDQTSTAGISVPGIYNVSNAAITPTLNQELSRRGINSVYGQAALTLNKYWTVDVTGRNDWSSTLPSTTNSYFYPSASTSLVLSDMLPNMRPAGLSFLKLRGSIAQVGADADPYQLYTTYTGQATKFGSLPQFTLSNTIANPLLKPERTTSSEGGVEVGFLDNRVTLDATYYSRRTDDQIITLQISNTTGFSNKAINAGRVTNKGLEALLTLIPVRSTRGLTWTSTVNFTTNKNKIVTLAPDLSTVVLGSAWSVNVEARQGQLYGALFGNPYLRDSTSGQLLLSGGLPQVDPTRRVLGNYNPDWTAGFNNEFRYKRVTVSGLIDVRHGGQMFSVTNMFGDYTGVFSNTLAGREVDWDNPKLTVQGIDQATKQANTTKVTSEDYFQSLYGIHEAFIYDAGFVKLRELRVGYDIPPRLLNRINFHAATIALVGRNLWMHANVPNIDPETALSTGNVQGLEFATIPTTRSIGFNLTFTP